MTGLAPETATILASLASIEASVVVEVVQIPRDIVLLSVQDLVGSVGHWLEDGVRVRVADASGNGVPGIAGFSNVLSGEGTTTPDQGVTASDGTSTMEGPSARSRGFTLGAVVTAPLVRARHQSYPSFTLVGSVSSHI